MPVNGRNPAYLLGFIIPLWLLAGLWVTGSLYPGYNHMTQAMSALGAVGAPTQSLSPLLNNYPLGLMFIVFAIGMYFTPGLTRLARLTAVLIGLHGVANFFTGFFPCDTLCTPDVPSLSQQVHNAAGGVMILTLLAASVIWSWLAFRVNHRLFGFFSLAMTFLTLASLMPVAVSAQIGKNFGLYQRIDYAIQLLWLAGLAFMLMRRSPR